MLVKTLSILLAEWIKVPSDGLQPLLERKIHERLVFTNPDYELRHNRGDWIGNIPPQISCIRQKGRSTLLPRGFFDQLLELCKRFQQPYRVVDRRRGFPPIDMEFHGELKNYQQEAAEAVLEKDFATLIGGHKSGKTVIALNIIAQRRQPTLILIPKLDLLQGWLTKIENFLQIPRSEVGIFAEGSQQVGKQITIAHTGEALRHWRRIYERIGLVVMDECQRCPSKVMTQLIPCFDSRYMLGLSTVAQRKDRLSRLVYFYIGDVVYTIDEKDAREGRGIIHAHVVARPTDFEYPYHSRADYPLMLDALMRDEKRTRIIADDIQSEMQGRTQPLLILSGGEVQDKILGAELDRRGVKVISLNQEACASELNEPDHNNGTPPHRALNLPEEPAAILVSPQTMIKCLPRVNSRILFLAVPLYFRQHLANVIRDLNQNGSSADSRLKIYDYVDQRVGLFENYFRMRSYSYGVHPDLLLSASNN